MPDGLCEFKHLGLFAMYEAAAAGLGWRRVSGDRRPCVIGVPTRSETGWSLTVLRGDPLEGFYEHALGRFPSERTTIIRGEEATKKKGAFTPSSILEGVKKK